MARHRPSSLEHDSASSSNIVERVRDRVALAGRSIDRKFGKSSRTTDRRETRSLLRVYRELRATYRQNRELTGHPAVPELREAVRAFKKGPSVQSLSGIAMFLDERSLLKW